MTRFGVDSSYFPNRNPEGPGPPSEVFPYRVLGTLGEGAMARVYRAQDHLGQVVALKMLHNSTSPQQAARLEREGEIAAKLTHPNVLRLLRAGSFGGLPYLAFELIEDARELDQVFPRLERSARIDLLIQVAAGVAHAHEAGIVHRDLKPSNVLVDRGGVARVADFGVGRDESLERMTRSGVLVGTPQFMAPEQIQGKRALWGPPSDVWGLGVMLYQALTDALPFQGDSLIELSARIVDTEPPAPRSLDPSISKELAAVCLRALKKNPEGRFAHAGEFGEALDLARHSEGKGSSSRRFALGLLALSPLLGALVTGLILAGQAPTHAPTQKPTPTPTPDPGPLDSSPTPPSLETEREVELLKRVKAQRASSPKAAEALLVAFLEDLPESAAGWELLGDMQFFKDPARSAKSYERSLAIRPSGTVFANYATALHRSGDSERALEYLSQGQIFDPTCANVYRRRALIQVELGSPKEALLSLKRAFELEPAASEGLNTKGLALYELGRREEAAVAFRASLKLARDTSALRNLGVCLSEMGRHEEGVKFLEEAILQPGAPKATLWKELGVAHLNRKKFEKAISAFGKALELAPEDSELYYCRGAARRRSGDLSGARSDVERYLELAPEDQRYRAAAEKLERTLSE